LSGTGIARSVIVGPFFSALAFIAAFAAVTPAVATTWTYADLTDTVAKIEGGYVSFDDTMTALYTSSPHGGYNTTSNKCGVCHAVHRADGAYYLLRADSQDDACSYCHIESGHSNKVVYDVAPGGMYTANGHTIGASSAIPNSTTRQTAQSITLSTCDLNGELLQETIRVRTYEADKNRMYRLAREHTQGDSTFAGSLEGGQVADEVSDGFVKIGPLALTCVSCHDPHNGTNQIWGPAPFASSETTSTGYKLLRRSPSGSTVGAPNYKAADDPVQYFGYRQVVKVIEQTATAGVNFSQTQSGSFSYVENGAERAAPVWIAQQIQSGDGEHGGVYPYPDAVNSMTLSWWCGDCHNLNIGGREPLDEPELGFRAHTERTHPVPYRGANGGPGQCYSCHRADLSRVLSTDDCSQCHYGSADYYENRGNQAGDRFVDSDFPHGGDGSFGMLGDYSVKRPFTEDADNVTIVEGIDIDETTLDAVCIRCHSGVGIYH